MTEVRLPLGPNCEECCCACNVVVTSDCVCDDCQCNVTYSLNPADQNGSTGGTSNSGTEHPYKCGDSVTVTLPTTTSCGGGSYEIYALQLIIELDGTVFDVDTNRSGGAITFTIPDGGFSTCNITVAGWYLDNCAGLPLVPVIAPIESTYEEFIPPLLNRDSFQGQQFQGLSMTIFAKQDEQDTFNTEFCCLSFNSGTGANREGWIQQSENPLAVTTPGVRDGPVCGVQITCTAHWADQSWPLCTDQPNVDACDDAQVIPWSDC